LKGLPSLFEKTDADQRAEKEEHEKQLQALYEQIGRLTSQVAWLKNLASTLRRQERLAFIEREHSALPLVIQAELLGISRASRYYQPAVPSAEEVALKHRIDEIYTAYPFYGSRPSSGVIACSFARQSYYFPCLRKPFLCNIPGHRVITGPRNVR
jgi:putative transposase